LEMFSVFATVANEEGRFGNANNPAEAVGRNHLENSVADGWDVRHQDCPELRL
jgi:hypothetical protein